MQYINWNIKCYCNIEKIIDFLLERAEEEKCVIALQEVMPDRANIIKEKMSNSYSISYSLDLREPGKYDSDNRRLGVMILVSKDMRIVDTGVFERCLFPERTLYATVEIGNKKMKVVTLHSITGVSFKMGKAVQFRSFAECINDYKPDIISMDANEPKTDHFDISKMEFFDQGDDGKGAELFFKDMKEQHLVDAYSSIYDISQYTKGEPLATSHILPNGVHRRYDFVFIKESEKVKKADYLYEEACNASSDHAMVIVYF